jgi:chemotaxis protein CheX
MTLHNLITESIRGSAANVFSTMLSHELPQGDCSLEVGTPDQSDGVLSFIGIAGAWAGMGSISCSPTLACYLCSRLLQMDATAVDEEVLDAIAELTNMIIGSVKTDLEQHLGTLGLSIPTVVFGRNFKTRSCGEREWLVVRFALDGGMLTVKLCLSPNEQVHHQPIASHQYALEV